MELYGSPYHSLRQDDGGGLYRYVRTATPWPDEATLAAEFAALERALDGVDLRLATLLIDSRQAPAASPTFAAVTHDVRGRLTARFRRSAVLIRSSVGAREATGMVLDGRQDTPVFSDEPRAIHYLAPR